jgi:hypothetical protein
MNNGNLTLQPGIYLINGGGFQINNGTLTGTGVMIYNGAGGTNAAGALNFGNSAATITLSPPTTGTYAGVTLYQDRSINQQMTLMGNNNITGAIYAAAAPLKMVGGSTAATVMGGPVICSTAEIQNQIQIKAGSGSGGTAQYGLVE